MDQSSDYACDTPDDTEGSQGFTVKIRRGKEAANPDGPDFNQGEKLIVHIIVRENNIDQALRALKKKLQREGVYREMKLRRHFEKPSEKKKRERAEAVRRARKFARKRAQREGNL